jgi:hypothetical protein
MPANDPVRLGSDPPPEGSQSADNYDAPTRVGESAYAVLARSMTDDAIVGDAAASTAATVRPPPPAAGTPPAEMTAEAGKVTEVSASAPSPAPAAAVTARAEIAIAVASFLAVAIPAVLYVMYLR